MRSLGVDQVRRLNCPPKAKRKKVRQHRGKLRRQAVLPHLPALLFLLGCLLQLPPHELRLSEAL